MLSVVTEQDYQLVQAEVKSLARKRRWSLDDEQDFVQEVYVKLLEQESRGVKSKDTDMTKGYLRMLLKRMLMDAKRKDDRRPDVAFNSWLADKVIDGGVEE